MQLIIFSALSFSKMSLVEKKSNDNLDGLGG